MLPCPGASPLLQNSLVSCILIEPEEEDTVRVSCVPSALVNVTTFSCSGTEIETFSPSDSQLKLRELVIEVVASTLKYSS